MFAERHPEQECSAFVLVNGVLHFECLGPTLNGTVEYRKMKKVVAVALLDSKGAGPRVLHYDGRWKKSGETWCRHGAIMYVITHYLIIFVQYGTQYTYNKVVTQYLSWYCRQLRQVVCPHGQTSSVQGPS